MNIGENSIGRRFLIPTLLLMAALLGLLGLFMTMSGTAALKGMMESKGTAQADFMTKISAASYQNFDVMSLEDHVRNITKDPEVAFAVFTDLQNKPVTKASSEPVDTAGLLVFEKPVVSADGVLLGRLKLAYHRTALAAGIRKNVLIVILSIAIAIALFAAGLTFLVDRLITRRVRATVDRIRDVAQGEGDLTKRLTADGRDELSELARWFNTFLDNLQSIIGTVQAGIGDISTASRTFTGTAGDLKQKAGEQRAQTEQVATAMSEMSQTITDVAKNASETASTARESADIALRGKNAVERTVQEMVRIAASVGAAAGTITELGKSSAQIGEIVTVINGIADQTNLLALNAAIEAARAGEQGRGFAVVADEVRKLAERTAHATGEIAERIRKIQADTESAVASMTTGKAEVENGVKLVEETKGSLDLIFSAATKDMERVSHIAAASEEQSSVAEDVTRNMDSIVAITVQTAGTTDRIAAASGDLERLSSDLKAKVGWFNVGRP